MSLPKIINILLVLDSIVLILDLISHGGKDSCQPYIHQWMLAGAFWNLMATISIWLDKVFLKKQEDLFGSLAIRHLKNNESKVIKKELKDGVQYHTFPKHCTIKAKRQERAYRRKTQREQCLHFKI